MSHKITTSNVAIPDKWKGFKRLSGEELKAVLVGNTMTGRYKLLIKWAMHYQPNGTTSGKFTFLGRREGEWWQEEDVWCAAWPMMNNGQPNKYIAFQNGDYLKWFKIDGEEMANDLVVPGNPFGL